MPTEIPFETLYDLALVSDVALSPTGERVAFVADEFDRAAAERRKSLFVAPVDGSADPHRLTRTADATRPRWSPDGSKLGFLATRSDDLSLSVGPGPDRVAGLDDHWTDEARGRADETERGGPNRDESEAPTQLWVFDLDRGGDPRQVTTRDTGVRDFDWNPTGDRVVISARDPTEDERARIEQRENGGPVVIERLQHKFDGNGWLDTVTTYLFVVDVETREHSRLDDAYGSGACEPYFGLQPRWGRSHIAFLSCRTERSDDTAAMDIYTIRPDGSDLRRLTDGDMRATGPTWAPGGDRLAFVGRDPENFCIPAQIFVGNVATGECRSLTDDLDRTLTHESTVRWLDDETLVTPLADQATTRLLRIAADGGTHEWVFDRVEDDRTIMKFDLQDETAALVLTRPGRPPNIYTMPVGTLGAGSADPDTLVGLSSMNDEFRTEYPMPDYRRISFESDGHTLDGLVYLPPGFEFDNPDPHPVIVSIHGGPVSYDVPEFSFEYAAWTSRGYVVFCPNYRGGSSYGRAFAETLRGNWGTVEVADVVAGVETLVNRGWVNSDRVFGSGFSYGATAQAHIAAKTDLFTAAAPEHGIYDVRADFGTSDWHVGYTNIFGVPWENPDVYDEASSITDVDDIDTPLLVMAGGEDWRCPPNQAEQLYVNVKKRGIPAKLVVYPDENHNIDDPDRAIHRLEQLEAWFERHNPGRD